MTRRITADICVLGAGSAGLSVAAGAAQMGASVVLLEGGMMGGDCLNTGCVPSKALIAAARHARAMTDGAVFGIAPAAPQVDFAAVKDHVARAIAGIAPHDSVERYEALGVRVIRAYGRFVSPRAVEAGDAVVTARRFVIATGSRPRVPPVPGLGDVRYFTNEDIFALRERPEHLVLIGGGAIGLEMAQAHRRLGSRVTVLEAGSALGREDPELAAVALERLRAEGIAIVENASVERVDCDAATGGVTVRAGGVAYGASHLLVAVGREVDTAGLGLEAAGVRTSPTGIAVNARLRSSNRRVYAIGDAAGGAMFTHVAGHHATVVLRSALFGLPARARTDHIPRATFTDPELAQVGLTEAEARAAHGDRLEVLRVPYVENDRARTDGVTEGLIKVVVLRGRPIGAGIVGAHAGELIGLWALALASRLDIAAVANMVAPYPTLGEISKRAAGQFYVPRLFRSPTVRRIVRIVQRFG